MHPIEQRFADIAHDVLLAVSVGELPPDAPVVRAAARAIAALREAAAQGAPGPVAAVAAEAAPAVGAGEHRGAPSGSGPAGQASADRNATAREAAGRADPAAAPGYATAAGLAGPGVRAPRVVPPIEHVLGVATLMREGRLGFPAACQRRGEEVRVSAQAVRNACCRWLGLGAADWQPLSLEGADGPALAVARRVAERLPWAGARIAEAFRVPAGSLVTEADTRAP